jgi:Zn-finger nucleic acid-binding protein
MALCSSCSAPLPANTSFCSYCGTRNDLDVLGLRRFSETREESHRHCPDCTLPLETIRLGNDGSFAVERCPTCFGLFFDPGEVQAFLESTATPAFTVNYQEIVNINRERASQNPVRYVKCPECGKFMNRVRFATSSGVVVDQCRAHGVWLDNGELIHLMEWKRAGGQLLTDQRDQARREEQAAAARTRAPLRFGSQEPANADHSDMLSSVLAWLFK